MLEGSRSDRVYVAEKEFGLVSRDTCSLAISCVVVSPVCVV